MMRWWIIWQQNRTLYLDETDIFLWMDLVQQKGFCSSCGSTKVTRYKEFRLHPGTGSQCCLWRIVSSVLYYSRLCLPKPRSSAVFVVAKYGFFMHASVFLFFSRGRQNCKLYGKTYGGHFIEKTSLQVLSNCVTLTAPFFPHTQFASKTLQERFHGHRSFNVLACP